jgi:uncharacterized membrane protein (UPF0127 family)
MQCPGAPPDNMASVATQVVNQTRGTVVCESTEVAATMVKRLRGLLGRSGLDHGSGMLFKGESSIHSAFMRFDFDAVFMDRELRVVKLATHIRPWRAVSAKRARNVLELAAGEIEHLGIQVGDQLVVREDLADATA